MSDFGKPGNSPFSDPSVQQAAAFPSSGGAGQTSQSVVDAYRPYEQSQQQQQQQQQQQMATSELEKRQRELDAKARELEEREAEHTRREEEMAANDPNRGNNWPPLPSFCPVGPCFYQDFEREIPHEYQNIVKLGYYLWMGHVLLLVINILGALAYLIAATGTTKPAGSVFFVSLLICAAFTPLSFLCWFRPLYKAFRNDSSFNFFLFFIIFGIQAVLLIVQCIGLDYLGSCGWLNGIGMLSTSNGTAIFMLVIAGLFTALAIVDLLLLIRIHRMYRSSGASFAKAKQEFTHGVATNETVRSAAADAAIGGARAAAASGSRY